MTRLAAAIERLSAWMALLAAVILGLMTVLILVEIFLWNVFEKTTLIADEYSAYGLAAIVFLAGGFCLRDKGHIRINLLLAHLPGRVSRLLTFLSTLASTAFMGYLLYFLFRMTSAAWRYGSTSGTLTDTPLWIPQGLMLVGAAVFFLQFVASSIRTFVALRTGDEVF